MFITLDGIDGGGKSTQAARLSDHLRAGGHRVLNVRDPGGTPTGEAIRGLLLDSQLSMHRRSEALLFIAARCELVERQIRPAIADGVIVISDRFLLANVVYQSVDSELDPDELWRIGDWANGGLRPDLTLLLDMPAEASLARLDRPADRMEARGLEYMEKVRREFLNQLPKAAAATAVIDAAQAPDLVHRDICDALNRWIV